MKTAGARGKSLASRSHKSRKRIIITRVSWSVFFILVIAFFVSLPSIVESYVINRLEKMGLIDPHLMIRSIGFNKLDIKSLSAGNPKKPDLLVPSLSLDFSLPGLLLGKMKKMEIAGMKLRLDIGKEGVSLKGLKKSIRKEEEEKGVETKVPFDELRIFSSNLDLTWQDRKIMIPFEFRASRLPSSRASASTEKGTFTFSGSLRPFGEQMFVRGTVNMRSGSGNITVLSDNIKLHRYFEDLAMIPSFFLESGAKLRNEILLDKWEIEKWDVSLSSDALNVILPGGNVSCNLELDFKMGPGFKPEDISLKARFKTFADGIVQTDIPFDLKARGDNLNTLKFILADLRLKDPPGMMFKKISGTISGLPGKFSINGTFSCEHASPLIPRIFPWLRTKGDLKVDGDFRINLTGGKAVWDIKGRGSGNLYLNMPEVTSRLDNLSLLFSFSSDSEVITANIDYTARGARLEYDNYVIHAERLISQTCVQGNLSGYNQVSGKLEVFSANIVGKDVVRCEGFDLDFPYRFPFSFKQDLPEKRAKHIRAGSFKIKSLHITDLNLGEMAGNIKQDNKGFHFSGNILSPVKELAAKISGNLRFIDSEPDVVLKVEVDKRNISTSAYLGPLHPSLENYRISGCLSGSAEVSFENGQLKSGALLELQDVNLEVGSGSIKCSGMNAKISMKNMIGFTSDFSQELRFANLEIGGIVLNGGTIVFWIENSETVFVEKGEFSFCDGKLLISPFKYKSGEEDFKLTLFCDRIDFDKMVNLMMGKQIASGDAELNGILPIRISKGMPVFSDGYLYSTPGVRGNLKFKQSGIISGGVLIVEEAMKDFNYDWIKLKLNTTKEKLTMVALVNGTPAQKLPLIYDSKSKDIVRDKKGKRRLNLKGLLLELRFTDIDLKQLLQNGAKIYSIKKNNAADQ